MYQIIQLLFYYEKLEVIRVTSGCICNVLSLLSKEISLLINKLMLLYEIDAFMYNKVPDYQAFICLLDTYKVMLVNDSTMCTLRKPIRHNFPACI